MLKLMIKIKIIFNSNDLCKNKTKKKYLNSFNSFKYLLFIFRI